MLLRSPRGSTRLYVRRFHRWNPGLIAIAVADIVSPSRPALLHWMDRAEADLDAVPSVDRNNQQCGLHLLLIGELRFQRLINVIGWTRSPISVSKLRSRQARRVHVRCRVAIRARRQADKDDPPPHPVFGRWRCACEGKGDRLRRRRALVPADVIALSASAFRADAQVAATGERVYVLLPKTSGSSSVTSWVRGVVAALRRELGGSSCGDRRPADGAGRRRGDARRSGPGVRQRRASPRRHRAGQLAR